MAKWGMFCHLCFQVWKVFCSQIVDLEDEDKDAEDGDGYMVLVRYQFYNCGTAAVLNMRDYMETLRKDYLIPERLCRKSQLTASSSSEGSSSEDSSSEPASSITPYHTPTLSRCPSWAEQV